jgi:O-antigen ligase
MSCQKGLHVRIFVGVVLLIELAGMYFSGYRGLWYAIGVFLMAFAFIQKRAWLLLGATLASLPFLPVNFFQRFQSLFELQYADSSQFSRLARAMYALDQMRDSPISGVGWGGSGYVHSDLIQIGANLGVPALLFFVLWLLNIAWKMLKQSRSKSWGGGYAGALFATVCGLIVVFAGEGLIVFVQLMVPVWFLFSMAYKLIELDAQEDTSQSPSVFQIREG